MRGLAINRIAIPCLMPLALALTGCGELQPRVESSGPATSNYGLNAPQRSAILRQVTTIAQEQLGTPYQWGGSQPGGFDCSGLVQYSYRRAGVTVPRTVADQWRAVHPVVLNNLQKGDLLFFETEREGPSHVAIYDGSGQFIHAPATGKSVTITPLYAPYWHERLLGAGRFF